MTEDINWDPLGKDWWMEAGKTVNATEQQIRFAVCKWKGMTATGAAKAAGYATAGDEANARQAGHRAAHSTAVVAMMGMAQSETGDGPDGCVDMAEAKQFLSRLARNSDATTKIRAIEALNKIGISERELELRERETVGGADPMHLLKQIAQQLLLLPR